MSLADQIAYTQSMMDHICTILVKLEKPCDSFEEPGIHAFLLKMRVTKVLHEDWDTYTKHDLMRVVARLKRIHAEYEKQLEKRTDERRSVWAELRENETRLIRDCLTREQAIEWMQQYARTSMLIEYFEYGGIVSKVQYWKKREQPVRLYRFNDALEQFKRLKHQVGFEKYEFEQLFEERKETAWPEILYRPLFTIASSQQTREQ